MGQSGEPEPEGSSERPRRYLSRYEFLKKKKQKGYAQLETSHGALNLELHVDSVPMTCENFISLATRGYYDGLSFHRLLRNFMVR